MEFTITIEGTAPLIMHSARLSNPLDPAAKALKAVTAKRVKTDEDHERIAQLEHVASLYLDPAIGPYVPGENIARCLIDGARITRAGKKVERGVFVSSDVNPLSYSGPRDSDGLWADENFRLAASVKVGTQRVMRTRPIFRQWRTQAEGILDPAELSLEEFRQIVTRAGQVVGLGDWRPRYGRFTATVEKV
jgi:hypothetical protein